MSDFFDVNESSSQFDETLSESQKDRKIETIITELATDSDYPTDKKCFEHADILNEVYSSGTYKTKFSDVFRAICGYFKSKEKGMEILQVNLEKLESAVMAASFCENTVSGFAFLLDAINLEIARYNYLSSIFTESTPQESGCSSEDISVLKTRLKKLERNAEISNSVTSEAKKAIIHVDDKLEKNSVSSITALTIFSAVILSFSGGLTVISGILEGMAEVSALRLSFCGSLLGFILFNTIFMLLYIVGKMTGKNITIGRESEKSSDYENGFSRKNSMLKIFHRYFFVFAVDTVFVFMLYYSSAIFLFSESKNTVFREFPNNFKIFVYILPIIITIVTVILSFQPFIYKIQQKRQYFEYKARILSKLAIRKTISNYFCSNSHSLSAVGKFERTAENDVILTINNALLHAKESKLNIEKFLENEIHSAYFKMMVCGEERPYITLPQSRSNKEKIKCIIKIIKSNYL